MPDLVSGLEAMIALSEGREPEGWTRHMRPFTHPNRYPEQPGGRSDATVSG